MKKLAFISLKYFFIIFIFCFLAPLIATSPTASVKVKSRGEWACDESIVSFDKKYVFPKKVTIVLIGKNTNAAASQKDLHELYYYFASRSGVGDLPFHYIVGWDGNVYSGNKLGDEAKISLGHTNNSLIIGYIKNGLNGFNVSAISAMKDIILQSANNYAIPPNTLAVYELKYKLDENGALKDVELADAGKRWKEDVDLIKQSVKANYSPQKITYKAKLISATSPKEQQKVEKTIEIKIKVKNTGEYNFYGDTGSNLFVGLKNESLQRSAFYLADAWDSPKRVGLLTEGERLAKDEEKEFILKVSVPLNPPLYSENFVLLDSGGNVIAGTDFKIELKIERPDKAIIEITDTPVGYLNVRKSPSGMAEIIAKVLPGERFLILDYQSGYYKIKVGTKEGWVVNMYVKVVSSG